MGSLCSCFRASEPDDESVDSDDNEQVRESSGVNTRDNFTLFLQNLTNKMDTSDYDVGGPSRPEAGLGNNHSEDEQVDIDDDSISVQIGKALQNFAPYFTRQIHETMENAVTGEIAAMIREQVSLAVKDEISSVIKVEIISAVHGEFDKRFPQSVGGQSATPPVGVEGTHLADSSSKKEYNFKHFSVSHPPDVTTTHSPSKIPSESPQKKHAFQMSAPDDSFEIDDDEVHVNGHVSFPLVENKKPDTSLVANKLAAADSIESPKLPEVPRTPALVVNNESVSTEVAKIPEQAELKEAENATSSKTNYGLFSEPGTGMKLPPSPPSTTTTQTSVLLQSNLQTEKVAPEKGSSPSPFLFGTTVEKVSPFQFSVKEPSVFKLDATSDPKAPESNSVISSVPKNDHVKFSVSNKEDNGNGNDQNSANMLGKSELKSSAVPLATSTNGTFSFGNPTYNASTPNTASASNAPAFPSTNGTFSFGNPANNASTPNAASASNAPSPVSPFGQAPAGAPGFMFGSSTPTPTPTAGSFQFAGQPNQTPPQNPFQSSSVEFNAGGGSFSLGSGGDISGWRIVRVKTKNRRT